jgi:competence protein ComEA
MIAIRKITSFILSWLLLSVSALAAVNVNTASFDELQTISGIGPATAQRIVDERRKGPFKSLDDLQARVKGIGESRVRKMAAAGLTVGRAAP